RHALDLRLSSMVRVTVGTSTAGLDRQDGEALVEDDDDVRAVALGDVHLVGCRQVAAVVLGRRPVGRAALLRDSGGLGFPCCVAGQRRLAAPVAAVPPVVVAGLASAAGLDREDVVVLVENDR